MSTAGISAITGGTSTAAPAATRGGASTGGGAEASGGMSSVGPVADPSPEAFSFFAFGDAHAGQNEQANATLRRAFTQMARLEPQAVFAVSNGDLVEDSVEASWAAHDAAVSMAFAGGAGTQTATGIPRYIAALDNHDLGFPTPRMDWLIQWNRHLPAQQALGQNSQAGVYYAVSYRNTLLIVLDSIHPSPEQTNWLASVLSQSDSGNTPVKLVFFHEPIYACSSEHPPFAAGLPWTELFERHGVKLVFVSHMHFYERTCPLSRGTCQSNGTGIVYQQLGPLGATNFRSPDVTRARVTGKDLAGNPRTDEYSCSGPSSIVAMTRSNLNDFCRVRVQGCKVLGDCYEVDARAEPASEPTPIDSWQVDACDAQLTKLTRL